MNPKEKGKSLGELDVVELTPRGNRIVELKDGTKVDYIPPNRTEPQQTAASWARDHIFDKTVVRIRNLDRTGQLLTTPGGSRAVVPLDVLKSIRRIDFRVEADTLDVRRAVHAELENLHRAFPEWQFSASFGTGLNRK